MYYKASDRLWHRRQTEPHLVQMAQITLQWNSIKALKRLMLHKCELASRKSLWCANFSLAMCLMHVFLWHNGLLAFWLL
jgi:hypothetical protein